MIQKTDKATSEITQYSYDAENQLIEVSKTGMTASYRYDGLGRRIEKEVNGVIVRFIYDETNIIMEYDGSNMLIASYTFGSFVDEPLIMYRGGENYYYHSDKLGSIMEISDNTGVVVKAYAYDSYGNIVLETGSLENTFTYTGREFDVETGHYYYRARYYDPSIARFIQEDPIGFIAGDINIYNYVQNSPLDFTDPFGLKKVPGCTKHGYVQVGGIGCVPDDYSPFDFLFEPKCGSTPNCGKSKGECIEDCRGVTRGLDGISLALIVAGANNQIPSPNYALKCFKAAGSLASGSYFFREVGCPKICECDPCSPFPDPIVTWGAGG